VFCTNPVSGLDETDSPFANLSSEEPDTPVFFRRNYNGVFDPILGATYGAQGCASVCWSTVSQEEADDCARRQETLPICIPDPSPTPNNPTAFKNVKVSSQAICGYAAGGVPILGEIFTVEAGTFTSVISQADADQKAKAHADAMALTTCTVPDWQSPTNTTQSCTVICADGTSKTVVWPAGSVAGADQLTANAIAYNLACLAAQSFCDGEPEFYFNWAQSCTVNCADGTPFTFIVKDGVFMGPSQDAANASALAYACGQAAKHRICMLASAPFKGCIDQSFAGVVEVAGGVLPILWQVSSGLLPAGLVLFPNPNNTRQCAIVGEPVVAGDYTFKLKAIDAGMFEVEKEFTMAVVSI
jgi:hypothetical protein